MKEQMEQQAAVFLAAIRDNLLKPMAAEICRKQSEALAAAEKRRGEELKEGLEGVLSVLGRAAGAITWDGEKEGGAGHE